MTCDDTAAFWSQVVSDSRRVLMCSPELVAVAREVVDGDVGLAAMVTVLPCAWLPTGSACLVDANAAEAARRQSIQRFTREVITRWDGVEYMWSGWRPLPPLAPVVDPTLQRWEDDGGTVAA